MKEAESVEKGWNMQLDALKKARSSYVKLGKDVFVNFFINIHDYSLFILINLRTVTSLLLQFLLIDWSDLVWFWLSLVNLSFDFVIICFFLSLSLLLLF